MDEKQIKKHFVDSSAVKSIHIDGYEISFESAISSLEAARLSKEMRKKYLDLLEEAQITPKGCLEKVKELQRHCSCPEIDNLLTYLYIQNKQMAKAEELIEEGYTKYPEYFFAKINYADQLLRKKKTEEFSKVFSSEQLKDNFSQRTKFHVSEYRSFMTLMSRYHLLVKNRSKAIVFYQKAHKADPAHLSVIDLEKALFGSPLRQKIKRVLTSLPFFIKKRKASDTPTK